MKLKITIEYENQVFEYQNGYQAYIFDYAIENEFDKKYGFEELKRFVYRVGECYLKDSNSTPLGTLTDFMAQNWESLKELSRYDILDKFYEKYI
ncbi:MAG: hypothetical protein E7347_06770 [Clostridiales bacterium]|nr:hypothetical protein [Clostridiales bacterium]